MNLGSSRIAFSLALMAIAVSACDRSRGTVRSAPWLSDTSPAVPKEDPSTSDSASSVLPLSYSGFLEMVFPSCVKCHANAEGRSKLSLATYQEVLAALEKIEEEVLLKETMPPSRATPLPAEGREFLRAWIDASAPEYVVVPSPSATVNPQSLPDLIE